jgi:pyridoxal phosphate enzyme (YggS family)
VSEQSKDPNALEPGEARAVEQRLARVRARIAEAAARSGRDPNDITLLGASKYQLPPRIVAALRAGLTCLGENYVQEARDKQPMVEALLGADADAVTLPRPRWHMIGALQRNKARTAVELFDAIETVDRASLAKELNKRAGAAGRSIDVFLQANLSREPQKAGADESDLPALFETCTGLEHLRLVGLMTVPAASEDPNANRPVFAKLRELRDEFQQQAGGEDLVALSMGMSHDFEVAIEEGATLVRVGRDLFGPRPAERPEDPES